MTEANPLPTASVHAPTDEAGRLVADVNCRRCGYNLRGLALQAACPECSTPIERSVSGDLLMFSDPGWLDRLARGTILIIAGLIAQFALGSGFLMCTAIWAARNPGVLQFDVLSAVGGAIGFATALIVVIGTWLVTTPDPATSEQQSRISARIIARYFVFLTLIAAPIQAAGSGWNTGFNVTPGAAIPPSMLIVGIVGMIVGAAGIVAYMCVGLHLRTLANRIPKPALAKQTLIVAIGYAACQLAGLGTATIMLSGLAGGAFTGTAGPGSFGVGFFMVLAGTCFAALGTFGFGIWALVLMFLYAGAFRQTAVVARQIWNRSAPPIVSDHGAASATM